MKFVQGGRYLIVGNYRLLEVWDLGVPGVEWEDEITPTQIGQVGTEGDNERFGEISNVMWVADGDDEKHLVRFATGRRVPGDSPYSSE